MPPQSHLPEDPSADALREISVELDGIRSSLRAINAERESASARVWDIVSKVSHVAIATISAFIWTMNGRVVELEAYRREIQHTTFTREDAHALELRLTAVENPQIALLVKEMRAMSLSVSERLTRLEVLADIARGSPK